MNKKNEKWLIENVHIIDGNGNEASHQYVLIQDGKIKKISNKKIFSFHTKKIDGTGKTLMPGLIDVHTHMQGINNHSEAESDVFLENKVQSIFHDNLFPYGITTIKDLGCPRHFAYKLRDKIHSGEILGPKFFIVGPNITAKEGHPAITLGGDNPWIRKELAAEISTLEEAQAIVKELAAHQVDFLKIVYQGGSYYYFDTELTIQKLDLNLVNALIEEAKKYGLKVTAHVRTKEDVAKLLTTNLYGIEHGITTEDIEKNDALLDTWQKQGAYYVPTLNALAFEHDKSLFKHAMHNFKYIFDKGIKIALGTDNMLEVLSGDVVHKELGYYVEAGLTPMQALLTATHNAAEYLGILERTGTIEVGKDADLLLLDSNPLIDIKNIQAVEKVWKEGVLLFEKNNSASVHLPDYNLSEDVELLYDDQLSGKDKPEKHRKLTMKPFEDGFEIHIDCSCLSTPEKQEVFFSKKDLTTLKWDYTEETAGTKLHTWQDGNTLKLEGIFRHKEVHKTYDLSGKLWMQMGEFTLGTFAISNADEIHYFAIGTGENRGALELSEFTSKKAGEEKLTVDGITYECVKVNTVITKYAFIWTGMSWYEKTSGKLIQYAVKGKEGNPMVLVTK